jgi:hypothetical protein
MNLFSHLWHDSALKCANADGGGWESWLGNLWFDVGVSGGSRRREKRCGLRKFTIAGRVVDCSRNGVADRELQVGEHVVYTGFTGSSK